MNTSIKFRPEMLGKSTFSKFGSKIYFLSSF